MRHLLVLVVLASAVLGISPAVAAAQTPASTTIAGTAPNGPLTVGAAEPESGGEHNIDFWEVQLNGGDQVVINMNASAGSFDYLLELYAPGTTDGSFSSAPPVDAASTYGVYPDQVTLQAPYTGIFILAVCEDGVGNVHVTDCRAADPPAGIPTPGGVANPMQPYTFATTLAGGVTSADAASESRASSMIVSAPSMSVGSFEAGGGENIDFWKVPLSAGDQVLFSTNASAGSFDYLFELYAPGTTDGSFSSASPVDAASTYGFMPYRVTLQAPNTGTFILAVCEDGVGNVHVTDCRAADPPAGIPTPGGVANPMQPYTFATTLASGPPPPGPASKPSNSSAPTVSGTAKVGQTLSSSTGRWSGTAPISYSYQWELCDPGCSKIGGATSSSHKLVSAEAGAKLEVVVTATNSVGVAQASSSEVGPIAAAGPTPRQVKASLSKVLEPSGKGAKIGALLKAGGYPFSFTAPGAGKLVIDWYATVKGKQELVASVTFLFHRARKATVKASLAGKGRQLLEGSKSLRLAANATFTPAGETSTSATKNVTIGR